MLGPMRQQQALPEARLSELEMRWAEASLPEAEDAHVLADRWETLPKPLTSEPRVVIAYADRPAELRWQAQPPRRIEQAPAARWHARLARRSRPMALAHQSTSNAK